MQSIQTNNIYNNKLSKVSLGYEVWNYKTKKSKNEN